MDRKVMKYRQKSQFWPILKSLNLQSLKRQGTLQFSTDFKLFSNLLSEQYSTSICLIKTKKMMYLTSGSDLK